MMVVYDLTLVHTSLPTWSGVRAVVSRTIT